MRIVIIGLLMALASGLYAQGITQDTKDYLTAKQRLRVGVDTARYWTSIAQTISAASTHRQGTTAKAVYDYCQTISAVLTTSARFSGAGTVGSPLELAQQGATTGQVLKWNGTAWVPAADDSGAMPQRAITASTVVVFDVPRLFGSESSPRTGNITFDFTGAAVEYQIMYHQAATAPTLPGIAAVNGVYEINVINQFRFERISASRVNVYINE